MKKTIAIIGSIIFLIIISAFIYNDQNNPIVGTWVSTQDSKDTWVFTSDNQAKSYYDDELLDTYTYKVTRDPVQCGVDMHETLDRYPSESILVLTNTQTNKQKCDLVYKLDEQFLTWRPFGYPHISHFKRQQ